jgi:hypothetical protein
VPLTGWTDTNTGKRLSWMELERMRQRAHRVYEVNSHIFEDEVDALTALGIVPLFAVVPDPDEFAFSPTPTAA